MLKKIIILSFVLCFSLSSMSFASESLILQGREFRITETRHWGSEDYNRAVTEQFGSGWEVADWVEIKQLFGQSLERARSLADFLTEREAAGAAVTVNGNKFWSGDRSYGINPLYHSPPSGYLAHDNIQNHMVSLGSWPSQRKILAVRDEDTCGDYNAGYQAGMNYCINNPSACGISTGSTTINADLSFSLPNATYRNPFGGVMEMRLNFKYFGEQHSKLLWELDDVEVR